MINLNQVNVIDNIIPSKLQDFLYDETTKNCSWLLPGLDLGTTFVNKKHQSTQIDESSNILNNIQENFQFSNMTMNIINSDLNPNFYSPALILPHLLMSLNYEYKLVPIKIKTNFQTQIPPSDTLKHNSPHTDLPYPAPIHSYTLIYYVMDSDGDTIIFNENYEGYPNKNFSIDKRIPPKKGRIILFPASRLHCGSHPIFTKARIVINANIQLIPL